MKYEQNCGCGMVQDLTGVREKEHIHIPSTQSLQAALTPPTSQVEVQSGIITSVEAEEDENVRTPSTMSRTSPIIFSSSKIVQHASCLGLVPRFDYLYTQALICIKHNGPYSLDEHKSLVCASMPMVYLSEKQFARSLSLAQDCHVAAQSCKRVSEDLQIHTMLGTATVEALEWLLDLRELAMEPFAWGILGLSSGYRSHDPLFGTYKQQLYNAINLLCTNSWESSSSVDDHRIFPAKTMNFTKSSATNQKIHESAMMLLQIIRKDWTRLRWYHGLQVVRRWIEHLDIMKWNAGVYDRKNK
jgi:hypothetical protein